MKNYYVKCIIKFDDMEDKTLREVNDEFWCTKDRYEFLSKNNAVTLIEVKQDKPKVSKPKKVK